MGAANPRIMLDTTVWIDFFVPGRSGSATAMRLVRSAIEAGAELLYVSGILSDLFYEVRRDAAEWVRASSGEVSRDAARLCHGYAWGCVEDLHELATAVGTEDADVHRALRYRSLSEDLEEVRRIQAEGSQKRREAEQELGRIESELKNKLLEMKG